MVLKKYCEYWCLCSPSSLFMGFLVKYRLYLYVYTFTVLQLGVMFGTSY